ncbi:MAG: tail fiber domain-containing protein [Saprospiraceae bacterium]|nr:tail fiber domain-containing protein [Saprospiraceae bacterium]
MLLKVNEAGDMDLKGALSQGSDINRKEQITEIDVANILSKLVDLPIQEWQYIGENVRHLGPMAQDFKAAFDLGKDDRTIAAIDADGVALAAIKAQQKILEEQGEKITTLEGEVYGMKEEITQLKSLLASLVSSK